MGSDSSDEELTVGHLVADNMRLFQTIVETVVSAVFVFRGDSICYVNSSAQTITGYSKDELLSIPFRAILHKDSQDVLKQRERSRQVDNDVPANYEIKIVRKDGQLRKMNFRTSIIEWDDHPAMLGVTEEIGDCKHADELLKQSEHRLRLAMEGTSDGLWDWNVQTGEVYFSPRWETMLGFNVGEVEPHVSSWEKLVHPDDIDAVMAVLNEHLEGHSDRYETEHRVRAKNGSWVWILGRGKVVERDTDGKPLRLVGAQTDITGRKQVEEYKYIVSSSSDMIAILDNNFTYLAANPAYLDAFNKTDDEVIGHSVIELFGEEFFHEVIKPNAAHSLAGEASNHQMWINFPAYGSRYMDVHFYPYFDSEDGIAGFVVNGRNITERKRAEDLLEESENQYRELFDHSYDVLFILDPSKGEIVDVNSRVEAVLGYTPDELKGRPMIDLHPDEVPELMAFFSKVMKKGHGHTDTLTCQAKSGEKRQADIFAYLIEAGEKKLAVAAVRDITERKQTEEQAQLHVRRMQALREALEMLNQAGSVDEVYEFAVQSVMKVLGCERASILPFGVDGKVHFAAWHELSEGYRQAVDGHCPWQQHETDVEPISMPDIENADLPEELRAIILDEGVRAAVFFPLNARDCLLGKYMAYFNQPHELSDEEMSFGKILAQNLVTALNRLENVKRLNQSEHRLALAMEATSDGLWDWNIQSGEVYFSPRWETMLGYDVGEVEPNVSSLRNIVHPDDMDAVMAILTEHLKASSDQYVTEHRVRAKDGSWLWVLNRGKVVERDANGKPLRLVGTQTDITGRKLAEEALRDSEAKLAEAQRIGHMGNWEFDVIQNRGSFSDETYRIFGVADDYGASFKSFLRFVHPDDRGLVKQTSREAISSGSFSNIQYRIVRPDGSVRFVQTNGEGEMDVSGRPCRIFGTIQDITERKLAEEALLENEERYRHLFENRGQGVMVFDANTMHLEDVNQAALDMYGYSKEEFLKLSPIDISAEKEKTRVVIDDIRSGQMVDVHISHRRQLKKDGSIFDSEVFADHFMADGRKKIFEIVQDITERKQAEEKLQQQEAQYKSLSSMLRLMCDNISDMIWAKDIDNHYIFTNRAMCDNLLHAKDTDEPVGKPDMFFAERERGMRPDDPQWHTFGEICRDSDSITLESGKAEQFDEFGNVRGKFLFLDVRKAPMFDEHGEVIGVVGSARDITESKRAEEKKDRLNQRQQALDSILRISLQPISMKEILDQSLSVILTSPSFALLKKGAIFLAREDEPKLDLLTHHNLESALQETCALLPFGRCLCGRAASSREIIFANHVDERHENRYEGIKPHGHYCVPILFGDEVLGVLTLYIPAGQKRLVEDELFLHMIAGTLALTIQRKHTETALTKSGKQLKTSLIGTVVAVSRAVGARDPYTAGHQQRVSQLSRAIAQEMGLDSERIDGLRLAASIHDIGKIYLPAEILSKPVKLSDIEYELIKSHAQVGYDILKDIEFPWPVAEIAWQHHERLDGSGYPQGLRGDEICLEARIVAVADVVEAISSYRPYRPALGIDAALEEITKYRGVLYDAVVVDTCLKLFREKSFDFEN